MYRHDTLAQKNPFYLGLYIASFPQLIAGPIVRYNQVAKQIVERNHSIALFASGIERFVFGLSKKVLIANQLGMMADLIFAQDYTQLSPGIAWLGIVCYTLQIYFDFSGYSDMAIGLGRMFGFQFSENFNYPVYRPLNTGFLETMAHLTVHLVQGLSLYTAGRQPDWREKNIPKPVYCLSPLWNLAWGKLEFCSLGADSRNISGP